MSPLTIRGRRHQASGMLLIGVAMLAVALAVTGCEETRNVSGGAASLDGGPKKFAKDGIKALQEGRLQDAQSDFNAALKLDIRSSQMQFLNGLTYHLRALREDRSLLPLAEEGYQLAIQFDPTNWQARYQLGLLYLDQRNFAQARTALADAMLYNDRDPDLIYSLAVAAYYAQDPVTAAGALTRLRQLKPNDPRVLRASTMVLAALGKPDEAKAMLSRYVATAPRADEANFLARRIKDWEYVHGRVQPASFRPPLGDAGKAGGARPQLAQDSAPNPFAPAAPNPFGAAPDASQPQPAPAPDQSAQPGMAPGPIPGAPPDQTQPGAIPGAPPDAAAQQPYGTPQPGAPVMPVGATDPNQKMVIVDVVIVSSEEDINTAKGVNLLNGLQFMFGSSSLPGLAASFVSGTGATHTITRTITIPAITYSLNIANSGTNRSEILARPSLVATSGVKSEFFSGSNIRAAAVATVAGGAPTGSIDVDKDIGVKLGITPQFLDSGKVRLQVEAERTFLRNTTSSVNFQFQINTSKTNVNANVVMNLGETLILSGLSEKETDNVRDGVPGLENVPGLQYFFSRQTTRDYNKSVLILLTPRTTEYVYRPRDVREREQATMTPDQRVLSELQSRYTDWFRPYPNWASVFHHLQENQLYREFRTGDVTLEHWETQTELRNRLSKLPDFLLY